MINLNRPYFGLYTKILKKKKKSKHVLLYESHRSNFFFRADDTQGIEVQSLKKMKRQTVHWKKVLVNHILNKVLVSIIYKELSKFND